MWHLDTVVYECYNLPVASLSVNTTRKIIMSLFVRPDFPRAQMTHPFDGIEAVRLVSPSATAQNISADNAESGNTSSGTSSQSHQDLQTNSRSVVGSETSEAFRLTTSEWSLFSLLPMLSFACFGAEMHQFSSQAMQSLPTTDVKLAEWISSFLELSTEVHRLVLDCATYLVCHNAEMLTSGWSVLFPILSVLTVDRKIQLKTHVLIKQIVTAPISIVHRAPYVGPPISPPEPDSPADSASTNSSSSTTESDSTKDNSSPQADEEPSVPSAGTPEDDSSKESTADASSDEQAAPKISTDEEQTSSPSNISEQKESNNSPLFLTNSSASSAEKPTESPLAESNQQSSSQDTQNSSSLPQPSLTAPPSSHSPLHSKLCLSHFLPYAYYECVCMLVDDRINSAYPKITEESMKYIERIANIFSGKDTVGITQNLLLYQQKHLHLQNIDVDEQSFTDEERLALPLVRCISYYTPYTFFYIWFPLLSALTYLSCQDQRSLHTSAFHLLLSVLNAYGGFFAPSQWALIWRHCLYPILNLARLSTTITPCGCWRCSLYLSRDAPAQPHSA